MGVLARRWIGAGVLAAGMTAAMLSAANLAAATPESGGDEGSVKSAESSKPDDRTNSADKESDSKNPSVKPNGADGRAGDTPSGNEPDAGTPKKEAPPSRDEAGATKLADPEPEPAPDQGADEPEPSLPEQEPVPDPTPTPTLGPEPTPAPEPTPTPGQRLGTEPDPSKGKNDEPEPPAEEPKTAPLEAASVAPQNPPEQAAGAGKDTEEVLVDEVPEAPADQGLLAVARASVDERSPTTVALSKAVTKAEEVAVAPAVATGPTLVNILGTLAWSVFDFVSKLLEGPPSVPASVSNVSVGRSKLEIDCGDGYTADADWYYPTTGTPDKIIYFQHGFPARAGFYNITAAELAERNNAIVVAPSITGNLFACDGCQLGADQMHAAVAKLFLGDPVTGDRTALEASAAAAGYTGELPENFVIAGHSGGGQLAIGAAGYYADHAGDEQRAQLKGVLLLDTSATGGALDRAMPKLDGIPVLHIAAQPAPLNTFGNANAALASARPGEFVGFQLVGGSHSDGFRSSTLGGLAQAIVSLAFGSSTSENVEAVQVLAHGWITDWFAAPGATPIGYYGDPSQPGSIVVIHTSAGDAQGAVLPLAPPALSPIDQLINAFFGGLGQLKLATCAVDPDDMLGQYPRRSAQSSTPNGVLSLDGRASRGQSVGQHVCTG